MEVVLGVDIGTTGAKCVVLSAEGKVLGTGSSLYRMDVPRPGWAEQWPEVWWEGVRDSVRRTLAGAGIGPEDIIGLGFTGQMHGAVVLDRGLQPIRPAILWCDQRTSKEVAEINGRMGGVDSVLAAVSNPALTGFTASKLLWLRNNEPESYTRIRHVLMPKDYAVLRATGALSADVTDASGTLLLDVSKRMWSELMLDALEIQGSILPSIHESTEVVGRVSASAAEELGIAEGCPVVAGAGDQAAGGVGTGAVQPGRLSIAMGTSGVLFNAIERDAVLPSESLHLFCHAIPETWHVMAVTLSAGGSMQWICDVLDGLPFNEATALAEEVEAGTEGLIFLPYLTGERTPHADPDARGVFIGLSYVHDRRHLIRSVMEGVAFSLADCLTRITEAGVPVTELVVSGGGSRSSLWLRILSSVLQQELRTVTPEEGPAAGAAILGGVGAGLWERPQEAVDRFLGTSTIVYPDSEWSERYAGLLSSYLRAYPMIKDLFPALAVRGAAS